MVLLTELTSTELAWMSTVHGRRAHSMVRRWGTSWPSHSSWWWHRRHWHTSRWPTLLLKLNQELLVVLYFVLDVFSAFSVLLATEG